MEITRIKGTDWKITENEDIFTILTRDFAASPWKWHVKTMDLDEAVIQMAVGLTHVPIVNIKDHPDLTFVSRKSFTLLLGGLWRIAKYLDIYFVQIRENPSQSWDSATLSGAFPNVEGAVRWVAKLSEGNKA